MKFRDGKSSTNKAKGKSVHVYMDGKRLVKRASFPHQMCGQVDGMRISENVKRSFTFADIRTTGASYPSQSHPLWPAYLPSCILQMKMRSPGATT